MKRTYENVEPRSKDGGFINWMEDNTLSMSLPYFLAFRKDFFYEKKFIKNTINNNEGFAVMLQKYNFEANDDCILTTIQVIEDSVIRQPEVVRRIVMEGLQSTIFKGLEDNQLVDIFTLDVENSNVGSDTAVRIALYPKNLKSYYSWKATVNKITQRYMYAALATSCLGMLVYALTY